MSGQEIARANPRDIAQAAEGLPSIETVKRQLAPKASEDDLRWYLAVAARLDLHPLAGHIVLIGRFVDRELVHRPQITVDGRRWIAQRTGRLRGIIGPEWRGPRLEDGTRPPWLEVWDEPGFPYAARAFVRKDGLADLANGTAVWREFAQTYNSDGETKLVATWAKMPSHMLGKVAESMALRRAFPEIQAAISLAGGVSDTGDDAEDLVTEATAGEQMADPGEISEPGSGSISARSEGAAAPPGSGSERPSGPTVSPAWAEAVAKSAEEQGIPAEKVAAVVALVTKGETRSLSEVRRPEADALREVLFRPPDER